MMGIGEELVRNVGNMWEWCGMSGNGGELVGIVRYWWKWWEIVGNWWEWYICNGRIV